MAAPVTFCRLYSGHTGIEYPAPPEAVRNVLASMKATGDLNPFRVRFRLDDGSSVIVKPRGWVQ